MFQFRKKSAAQAVEPQPIEVAFPMRADDDICRDFCQNGFTLLRGAFSAEQMSDLRRAAIEFLPGNTAPYKTQFANTAQMREPFRSTIFKNERLISALRDLLGDDFLLINEFSLQDCHYSGWHTDTTSPEAKAGHRFHWSPRFLLVNIAIYLQDGGLDVVPGSFMRDDPLAATMLDQPAQPDPYGAGVSVPAKVGDAFIFHLRTSHRATPVVDPADRKLALFMIAGANNDMTRRYREWIDQYDGMNGVARPAVPDEFRAFLTQQNLRLI